MGAAIYWNPEAYDASGQVLMGRHSAGESFIRGYMRHMADARLTLWNVVDRDRKEMLPLLQRLADRDTQVTWIGRHDQAGLTAAGVIQLPVPGLTRYAWSRRQRATPSAYSLCGITHTTATGRVLDALNELAIAPLEPWDALICTSRAVVASLKVQAEMLDDYLSDRFGATRHPRPEFVHIPLGINTSDFQPKPEHRTRWREQLGIAPDDVAALYVGRFSYKAKMNPVPMLLALERAAARTEKKVHWILAGWGDQHIEDQYKTAVRDNASKVTIHFVDGRPAENRFSIWSAGDVFLSLSDNIQETFGLTPVEAMAAGLPSVISDWDGYKDLVRHGQDGFRIATYTPRAGLVDDITYDHAMEWATYDIYVGALSQFTAVDVDEASNALLELIEDSELRERMGRSAQVRAKEQFDWAAIIPRYEALWAELDARRKAAGADLPLSRRQKDNPWRPDPLHMFQSYPTEWFSENTLVAWAPGMTDAISEQLFVSPVARLAPNLLPTVEVVRELQSQLSERRQCTIGELLSKVPASERLHRERGLAWLAKYGYLKILARVNIVAD